MTSFELELAPERANVAVARRFVLDAVHRLGQEEIADVAELLASELVTNAVLHAGTVVHLRVLREDALLRIEVSDGRQGQPTRRRYSTEAATGRGLALVEALASRWGTHSDGSGKTVWCTVGDVA